MAATTADFSWTQRSGTYLSGRSKSPPSLALANWRYEDIPLPTLRVLNHPDRPAETWSDDYRWARRQDRRSPDAGSGKIVADQGRGACKAWSPCLDLRLPRWGVTEAFARDAVRRSTSYLGAGHAGLAPPAVRRHFPRASHRQNWEADLEEIPSKLLILLVSALGIEPRTP